MSKSVDSSYSEEEFEDDESSTPAGTPPVVATSSSTKKKPSTTRSGQEIVSNSGEIPTSSRSKSGSGRIDFGKKNDFGMDILEEPSIQEDLDTSQSLVEEIESFAAELEVSPRPPEQDSVTDFKTVEELFKQIERLEKAHVDLENVIGLSDIVEEEGSISVASRSGRSHSASVSTSLPSKSFTVTDSDAVGRSGAGIVRKNATDASTSQLSQSRPGTHESSIRAIDDLLRVYDQMEKGFEIGDANEADTRRTGKQLKSDGQRPITEKREFTESDRIELEELLQPRAAYQAGLRTKETLVLDQSTRSKAEKAAIKFSNPPDPRPLEIDKSSQILPEEVLGRPPPGPAKVKADQKFNHPITHLSLKEDLPKDVANKKPKQKPSTIAEYERSDERKSLRPEKQNVTSGFSLDHQDPLPATTLISTTNLQTFENGSKRYDRPNSGAGDSRNQKLLMVENRMVELEKELALAVSTSDELKILQSNYSKLKEESRSRESQLLEQISQLKTEIATIKLNNLLPTKADSNKPIRKEDLDRLKAELKMRTDQVTELNRQISNLKLEIQKLKASPFSKVPKNQSVSAMSEEKEKEYQKNIRGLEKQIRTLQKIIYHKDPSAAMSTSMIITSGTIMPGSMDDLEHLTIDTKQRNRQLEVVENRVAELEKELAQADSVSNEKLKEFQLKFSNLRFKHDERIKELETKLEVSERRTRPPEILQLEETNSKLEKSHAEIAQLKLEISRCKRELEIAAKSTSSVQANLNTKQDAGTLSLAIKSFKAELSEKDKELIKTRKEVADLRKTNLHLKREREKYLSSANSNILHKSSLLNRTKSDLTSATAPANSNQHRRQSEFPNKKPSSAGSVPKVDSSTIQALQATLDSERSEFEDILSKKNRLLQDKENKISELKQEIKSVQLSHPRKESDQDNNFLLEELRTRVSTQNKVIQTLKEHISSVSSSSSELLTLRKEKGALEFRVRDLSQQLAHAKNLIKPENEILADLSEKVENLNSRYKYREKQLDLLLKTTATTGSYSTSLVNDLFGSSSVGSDFAMLSPTTSMQLLTDHRDI